MVITKNQPPGAGNEAWIWLGETSFYAYPLQPPGFLPEGFPLHECKE
jgi:hypothetical protein